MQHSKGILNKLAERDDINPKTVAKWKKRTCVYKCADGAEAAPLHLAYARAGSDVGGVSEAYLTATI
jgi:hypothetical protein